MSYFRCREPFSWDDASGIAHVVRLGDVVDEDSPHYRQAPAHFEPVHEAATREARETLARIGSGEVERATAAPGEKRSLTRPRQRPGAE